MTSLTTISTKDAAAPAGPYSQAIAAPPYLFVSGQIPLSASTRELVLSDITAQTATVFDNLAAVLAAGGSSLARVVKTTVFLADMASFAEMNVEYERRFGEHRPARSCVAVRELPKGVGVEVECVALL
ncbi:MAG: 2-iminobutanoate/2-iminopropanoate deaminase [Piccolia ochrophora]|nr:MAG: 2-iminobutanoate/2-iminopropanoate deaminase [Piccolia ochrophora]